MRCDTQLLHLKSINIIRGGLSMGSHINDHMSLLMTAVLGMYLLMGLRLLNSSSGMWKSYSDWLCRQSIRRSISTAWHLSECRLLQHIRSPPVVLLVPIGAFCLKLYSLA